MGRPVQTINEIIRGSKQITPETAIELSLALGISPEFWTNLEAKSQLHLVVCQIHFDGYKDAINCRLYSKFIRQLFLDRLLGLKEKKEQKR